MKKKFNERGAFVKRLPVLFAFILLLSLTACQATPDTVNDNGVLHAKRSNDLLVESLANETNASGETVAGKVPSLSAVEHLKRDVRSGDVTLHIDADIKVPDISGGVYSYTATYPFYDITELEKIFISGSSPLFKPDKNAVVGEEPELGLTVGGFRFDVAMVLSASNCPTAVHDGWAKGCDISPEEAKALADRTAKLFSLNDFSLVASSVEEPYFYNGGRERLGSYYYEYIQLVDGIPLASPDQNTAVFFVEVDSRGISNAFLSRLELRSPVDVTDKLLNIENVLLLLQKSAASAMTAKDVYIKEISFEYMSVENQENFSSAVFPCWRFCVDCEKQTVGENDFTVNAVTGEAVFNSFINRYESN